MPAAHTTDNVSIDYRCSGTGKRVFIFLHGWGGSAEFWDDFLSHLDLTDKRAVCISFRGHGRSARVERGFTFEQFARDVLAVADAELAIRFTLVGFSFGGKVAQYISAICAERVEAQILVAPVGPGEVPIPLDLAEQVCNCARDRDFIRQFFRPWFQTLPRPELFDAFVESIAQTPRTALFETTRMLAWTSIAEKVKRSDVPTLVVAGSADPNYSPEYQREQVIAAIPNARLDILDCGHGVPIEAPRQLARLLEEFSAGSA